MMSLEADRVALVEPGQQLRRVRERLRLKYRDVEEASGKIASQLGDDQFQIGLSRLADIENRGTVPSIYRMYSLCAIYRLDFATVLGWYGVNLTQLTYASATIQHDTTNLLSAGQEQPFESTSVPLLRDDVPDLNRTFSLTKQMIRWGRIPFGMLDGLDLEHQRYGFIGLDDWFMYPLLRPGSFIQIDESRRKLTSGGWINEWDRPIYLIEHREGYRCAWCSLRDGLLIAQPHPSSQSTPETYRLPEAAEIVGQVTGVAMRLHPGMRPRTHFVTSRE